MRYRKEFVSIWSILESCLWRKNSQNSLRKLRTPVIFLKERLLATETKLQEFLLKSNIVNF